MKVRPRELTGVAALFACVAIGLPVQIMMLYGHTPMEPFAIVTKMAPLNWAIFFLSLGCSWLVLRASRWAIPAIAALTTLVLYNNWFVGEAHTDYTRQGTTIASIAFMTMLAPLCTRRVVALIRNPERRWWLTPTRFRTEVPVRIKLMKYDGPEFYAHTFDLSEGGAFIPGMQGQSFKKVVGAQCFVSMTLKGYQVVQCRAEIVRRAEASGRYPAGIGIRFLGLVGPEKRWLAEYLRTLMPEKSHQAPERPESEEKNAA